jgi:DNA adenine methylase
MFDRNEFVRMAEQLAGIKGRFLLSINDHPEVRRIFAAFPFDEVRTRYTIGGNSTEKAKSVGELIITNPR